MDSDCTNSSSLDKLRRTKEVLRRRRYVYVQPKPSKAYKPLNEYKKPSDNFPDDAVNKMSCIGTDGDTAAEYLSRSLRGEDNLAPEGKMISDTSQRHDYRDWPEAVRYKRAEPHRRKLFDRGPMSSLITQKHDYISKPLMAKKAPFKPDDNIRLSDKCMEDRSIAAASYQPYHDAKPAESCKPRSYQIPSREFSKDTMCNMSYMPPPETERVHRYVKPTIPFEGNFAYSKSYFPPGDYVPGRGWSLCGKRRLSRHNVMFRL
jgi:hypothetical protein